MLTSVMNTDILPILVILNEIKDKLGTVNSETIEQWLNDNNLYFSGGNIGIGKSEPTEEFVIETTGTPANFRMARTDGSEFIIVCASGQTNIGNTSLHKLNFFCNGIHTTLETDKSLTFANGANISANGMVTNNPSQPQIIVDTVETGTNAALESVLTVNNLNYVKTGKIAQFELYGSVSSGGSNALLTLPLGYRPFMETSLFGVYGSAGDVIMAILGTNGELTVNTPASGNISVSGSYIVS